MEMTSFPRPDIGIMARVHFDNGVLTGKQGALLTSYLRMAQKDKVFACVFDPADVDLQNEFLYGYVLLPALEDEPPRVGKMPLQLPKVIYDQILSRRYESLRQITKNRNFLRKRAEIFNDGFFDKWQIYEWLSDEQEFTAFLPRTAKFSRANFLEYCELFPVLFLKPVHGSLGVGIIKLVHQETGWHVMIRGKSALKTLQFAHDSEEVFSSLVRRTGKKVYVLQEGIPLLEVGGRPLDVRVLLQKNEQGLWRPTKSYLRLAAKGEFVSNLARGGEAYALPWLKEEIPEQTYLRMRKQLRQIVKQLPEVLERKAKKRFGELGLDFGVDETGRVYILEVNSKPRKNIETARGSEAVVARAIERPLLYALRLAASGGREHISNI